jgi:hypothetical protein
LENQQTNPSKVKASAPPKNIVSPIKQQIPESRAPVEQQRNQKGPLNEVKVSDKVPYSFNFEAEIQKNKIPIPLVELMKNEMFKKDILFC